MKDINLKREVDSQMKKDGKTVIRYRPMSMYVEDYLPKQKEKIAGFGGKIRFLYHRRR